MPGDRGVGELMASLLDTSPGPSPERVLGFGPRFFLRVLYSQSKLSARQFEHCGGTASHLTLRRLHASQAWVVSRARILEPRAEGC